MTGYSILLYIFLFKCYIQEPLVYFTLPLSKCKMNRQFLVCASQKSNLCLEHTTQLPTTYNQSIYNPA